MGQSQGDEERGGGRREDAKLAFHYLTSAASAETLLSPERENTNLNHPISDQNWFL